MWLRAMIRVLVLTVVLALSTTLGVRGLGLPRWSYYAVLIVLAILLYVVNSVLIKRYISRRAPALASTKKVAPNVQAWELTVGTGVVPRWVSYIGLASVACLLALLFPVVASVFR